ncbi:hypothetical protein [Gayadomonas joobiniege]|uniref:hypothetical protein n=1 Tax=Gayadomonas joobiniege TaxID=1234606 RepID=UPI00037B0F1F|nr:hypothetical protein [Gayadomonas joobiniege]
MGGGDTEIDETPEQKAMAQVAMNKWNDYQKIYKPAENSFMEKVDRIGSDKQFQQATDQASVSINNSFSSAIQSASKNMMAGGINPSSGKYQATQNDMSQAQADAYTDTKARVNATQNERYIGGLKAISAMGTGKEAEVIAGMGDVAASSAQYAQNSAINQAHNNQMVGEAAGAALGGALAYGFSNKPEKIKGANAADYSDEIMSSWSDK